jgi:4-amino-4-deoxy-L-arabinose transferase-like glycosyltransferase
MRAAGHTPSARPAAGAAIRAAQPLQLLLVVATAVVLRAFSGTNVDVSWLITIGEKMLAGERLYVDLIEVNPPASAFLYLPAVLLARSFGLSPEVVVDALVFFAAGAGLWLAGRILQRTRLFDDVDLWSLAAWSAAVMLILPMHTFGEREHIATILLLPLLALLLVRATGDASELSWTIAAGIGAGLAIVIKPHFVIPVGLAAAAAAYACRSWRVLLSLENWIAGVIAVAYGAYVIVAYPEFIHDVMPLAQATYLPARKGLFALFTIASMLCWMVALVLLARWQRRALLAPPFSLLLAASIGFALVYFIQGKGWPYHAYPALALALIALALAGAMPAASPAAAAPRRLFPADSMIPVAVLAALSCLSLNAAVNMAPLIDPIRALKAEPTLLTITSDIAVGHPLVRELQGKWVSRVGSLWISAGVFRRAVDEKLDPEQKAALRRLAARDRDMLVEDIRRNRPDIILVEKGVFDWEAWARADPLVAAELAHYREAGRVAAFLILQRQGG